MTAGLNGSVVEDGARRYEVCSEAYLGGKGVNAAAIPESTIGQSNPSYSIERLSIPRPVVVLDLTPARNESFLIK